MENWAGDFNNLTASYCILRWANLSQSGSDLFMFLNKKYKTKNKKKKQTNHEWYNKVEVIDKG